MDKVLFIVAGTEISVGIVSLAGLAIAAVLLFGSLVAAGRRERQRLSEMADMATANLRQSFREHLVEKDRRIAELKADLDMQVETNGGLRARSAALEAQMSEQAQQTEENLKRFMAARQHMSDEFKVLASEILKSHGETFSKQNREQVDLLLKPLSEKLVEFQTGLTKDRADLGARIQHLTVTGLAMSQEANALTRALKGNAQVQGAWGEMILTTILTNSGLREGEHFRTQQSHTAEDGARLRTDVEIFLPNGDVMIIDSKVSLLAFEAYVNANEEVEARQQLKAHVNSVRSHIKILASKQYQRHAHSGFDFVLLFMPIEAAFSAAITDEPGLIEYAMGLGVLLTTPTTLLMALRTVANVWDIEKRQKNAEQIAERAGALYDKVASFLDSMDRVGQNLDRTRNVFNEARGQLSEGRGSIVRQVEMLRELGAKTKKQLPTGWNESSAELIPISSARGRE